MKQLVAAARFGRKSLVTAPTAMAISSHPVVTRTAVDVMRDGGNAVDAALAASVAQTVVEPHMSTVTGVLSLLHFDAATGSFSYVNGSAAAPRAELPGFSGADLEGGRAVAVPGYWAALEAAAERLGTWPTWRLVVPAVQLARDGFPVYPFLFGLMWERAARLGRTSQGREAFFPRGGILCPGETLRQARAADTLEQLGEGGAEEFYRGSFARELVDVVRAAGGVLDEEDLAGYEARWCEPARGSYRGYEVVASPPPDQGGSHLIEMLNMVELLDLQRLGAPTESADTLYQLVAIHNEVYAAGAAQRDPRSFPLPLELLLSKEWAATRLELLSMSAPRVPEPVQPGSNHLTVVDPDGNVATVLHSCMSTPWSNGLFAGGVSVCAAGAHYLRVMPRPGDRISSIVAPNMLCLDGRPVLTSGSPSTGLLANILQNLVNLVDFGLDLEQSVHLPRFGGPSATPGMPSAGFLTEIEVDVEPRVREAVAARGIAFDVVNPWQYHLGSFEAIARDPATGLLSACGDPRRNSAPEGF